VLDSLTSDLSAARAEGHAHHATGHAQASEHPAAS